VPSTTTAGNVGTDGASAPVQTSMTDRRTLLEVYVPQHFAPPDDAAVQDLLRRHGAADLVTSTADGLRASLLPFVYDEPDDDHPHGRLLGHVARPNEQWRLPVIGEAMVIVRGPDAYVSPAWYPSKAEHGRVVPTWNYVTAHVYGPLVVHDDADWVESLVRRLTAKHEDGREPGWSLDDAPPEYVAGQLRAIVGLEVAITRVEAKWKLSQNRPEGDRVGVVAALDGEPGAAAHDVADAMRRLD
jgi:transcriptional regulator